MNRPYVIEQCVYFTPPSSFTLYPCNIDRLARLFADAEPVELWINGKRIDVAGEPPKDNP